ncbi:MAG: N-acetyltransferase family protein [Planctomycetota bacterium]|nr:MAG: N-acetyltransferase family protein [Planctomycetota bacterium]
MRTRPATPDDLDPIFEIYEHEVLHGVATFDLDPFTPEERRAWFDRHGPPAHPVIVAQDGDTVVGWAALSPFSSKRAYARTAEVSVYVHKDHRGRGVGRALLGELIRLGRAGGLGVLLARIAAEQVPSLGLHLSLGFQHVGTMRRVGEKFGRVLDVELLDYQLDGERDGGSDRG